MSEIQSNAELVKSLLADKDNIKSINNAAFWIGKILRWRSNKSHQPLAQDAIVWALENAEKFPNRGDDPTRAFRMWMYGILKNKLKQHLSASTSEVEFNDAIANSWARDRLSVESEVITDDAVNKLHDALPPKHQKALSALIEGRSVEEAAQLAGLSKRDVIPVRAQLADCFPEAGANDDRGLLAPGCSHTVPVDNYDDENDTGADAEPSAIDRELAAFFSEPPTHSRDKTPRFERRWFEAATPPAKPPKWSNVRNADIREALQSTYGRKVEISKMVSCGDWQTPVPHYANLTDTERKEIIASRCSEQSKKRLVC